MIGLIDYGASNLASVGNALDYLNLEWMLCRDARNLQGCDRLILPGVGHFGTAMSGLRANGLDLAIRSAAGGDTPLLGVCLGAQLLLAGSDEAPGVDGLGLVPGRAVRLRTRVVPHMGWNRVNPAETARLFERGRNPCFYFAHSFVCRPDNRSDSAATARQDDQEFCVAMQRGRLFGVQFHPEKSSDDGLTLLRRFATC